MKSILEFKGISKYFPGVKALDNINFKAYGGEVLAFLGENGAGKSTLLKILNGDYQPTSGVYLIDNIETHFKEPYDAINAGVSVIYQERQILLELSVAENIFLGRMPTKQFGIIDIEKANKNAQKIIDDFGLQINPATLVKDLSVAYQQMVEIMKAYSRENLKIICFDEPSASLSDAEIESLFNVIENLKKRGLIIIYVTHRMSEIQRLADKTAIFKDGKYVDTIITKEVAEQDVIKMMVGRDLGSIYDKLDKDKEIGEVLLEVNDLSSDFVKPVSFKLRKGEILGFSGLVGAGRSEVVRAITGADKLKTGEIILEGKKIQINSPTDSLKNGIVLIPEDRKLQGIISNLDVKGNINISTLNENSNKLGIINHNIEKEKAERGVENFNIKTPNIDKLIVELSGGNQQKCIVARAVATNPKVLILDEPTKGIDIGAKAEFYDMICKFAKSGLGVILISSELPEIIGLSDRILVMKSLQLVGEVKAKDATEAKLLSISMKGME